MDIRKLRKKLILTQAELAELLGVAPTTVYRWESGRSRPQPRHLRKLVELNEKNRKNKKEE